MDLILTSVCISLDLIVKLECHFLPMYNSASLQSSCQDRKAVFGKGGGFYFC